MSLGMNDAMRRALAAVRAQDPMGATREIQAALGAAPRGDRPQPSPRPPRPAGPRRHAEVEVEDAEILDETPVDDAPPPASASLLDQLQAKLSAHFDPNLVSGLRNGRLPGGPAESAPGQPEAAQFLARSHSGPEGRRDYRLYIPSCGAEAVRGLVVMLHGCTQTPEDFARGTGMNAAAEEADLAVAWPEQTRTHNMQSCWNWFEASHQQAEAGEPAILAGLTRALCAEFDIPRDRCFVAGLSAGGAMAAILGETHPDLFGAIGVHSGLPTGAAQDMVSAFSAMRGQGGGRAAAASGPRLIVIHGDADRTVDVSNARRIIGSRDGAPTSERLNGATRSYRRTLHRDAQDRVHTESWIIEGAGHAWSGGHASGSYTDPAGPDASRGMIRFFLETR